MPRARQIAALPVRKGRDGILRVLLVTSRETRRWVVPKGWPWPSRPDQEAAAGEAWEEAGIRGKSLPEAYGAYTYRKRLRRGDLKVRVSVYLLVVKAQYKSWPEQQQRRREWFTPADAAAAVEEPKLKAMILDIETADIAA